MAFLPSVTAAEYRGGYRIHVTFNDAKSGTIDFSQWLDGPVFEPLKDVEYFRKFWSVRTGGIARQLTTATAAAIALARS